MDDEDRCRRRHPDVRRADAGDRCAGVGRRAAHRARPAAPRGDPHHVVADATAPSTSRGVPATRAVRRRTGGRRAAPRPDGTLTSALDLGDLTSVGGEQGLLGLAFHRRRRPRPTSTSPTTTATPTSPSSPSPPTATLDRDSMRTVLVDRPAVRQPQRRRPGVRPRRDALHRHGRRRRRAAIRNGGPSTSAELLGKMLRIDPTPVGRPRLHDPGRQPLRRHRRRPRRDLVDRPAQPVALLASTRPPATCGSPTSARTPSRRSTSPRPPTGSTPAGGSTSGGAPSRATIRSTTTVTRPTTTRPIFTYGHSDGRCSISGGVRARGAGAGTLDGWYVFADYCTGEVIALPSSGEGDGITVEPETVRRRPGRSVSAVRTGPDGAIYVLDGNGRQHASTPPPDTASASTPRGRR